MTISYMQPTNSANLFSFKKEKFLHCIILKDFMFHRFVSFHFKNSIS